MKNNNLICLNNFDFTSSKSSNPVNISLKLVHFSVQVILEIHSKKVKAKFLLRFPHNWGLRITELKPTDAGTYLCQLSTFPPKVRIVYLEIHGKCHTYKTSQLFWTYNHQNWNLFRSHFSLDCLQKGNLLTRKIRKFLKFFLKSRKFKILWGWYQIKWEELE